MQSAGTQELINRMIGAAKLDVPTYEDVERDQNATMQAFIVVALAGVATGIGSMRSDGFSGLIGGTISGILGWAVFSFIVYFVGTRFLATAQTEADSGQVMRALGFCILNPDSGSRRFHSNSRTDRFVRGLDLVSCRGDCRNTSGA